MTEIKYKLPTSGPKGEEQSFAIDRVARDVVRYAMSRSTCIYNSPTCCGIKEFSPKRMLYELAAGTSLVLNLSRTFNNPNYNIRSNDLFEIFRLGRAAGPEMWEAFGDAWRDYVKDSGFVAGAGFVAFAGRHRRVSPPPASMEEAACFADTYWGNASENNYAALSGLLTILGFHRVGDVGLNTSSDNFVDLWVRPRGKNYFLAKE